MGHSLGVDPLPPVRRRPWLPIIAGIAFVIAAAIAAFVLLMPAPETARLALTTCQVNIGDSYAASASGFAPGENVRFSWTGPTNGVMGEFPADQSGTRVHGGIIERDPPGTYAIIATGLSSGRTSSAGLVVSAASKARLTLSSCQITSGASYSVIASGFAPGENVRFSWAGPTMGVMDAFPTDPAGTIAHPGIVRNDPPGTYTIMATGLTSGRSASAGLQVLP